MIVYLHITDCKSQKGIPSAIITDDQTNGSQTADSSGDVTFIISDEVDWGSLPNGYQIMASATGYDPDPNIFLQSYMNGTTQTRCLSRASTGGGGKGSGGCGCLTGSGACILAVLIAWSFRSFQTRHNSWAYGNSKRTPGRRSS